MRGVKKNVMCGSFLALVGTALVFWQSLPFGGTCTGPRPLSWPPVVIRIGANAFLGASSQPDPSCCLHTTPLRKTYFNVLGTVAFTHNTWPKKKLVSLLFSINWKVTNKTAVCFHNTSPLAEQQSGIPMQQFKWKPLHWVSLLERARG